MSSKKKKIRCLIIQLGRNTDHLQSLMALRASQQLYPQLEIHYVAREGFDETAKRVTWLAEVHSLPRRFSIESPETSVPALAEWVKPLIGTTWDFVINWTYSEASSYLTKLIPGRVKLGFTRGAGQSQDNAQSHPHIQSMSCADGWSHYLQAVVQGGVDQNIHITDILTTQLLTALQIHLGEPNLEAGESPITSKSFFLLNLAQTEGVKNWQLRDSKKKWIGIQLGTSRPQRIWDPENWARIADRILEENPDWGIVVLGKQSDESLAERFIAELAAHGKTPETHSLISLAGEMDFDLWASVISQCQWLLASDSSAIHMASILGTRVLNLSFGGARWNQSGPYGNGHYVISTALPCDACRDESVLEHVCGGHITPDSVYMTLSYASTEWSHGRQLKVQEHFENQGYRLELNSIQIYRSRIRQTEEGGGVVYEAQIERSLQENEWNSLVMGYIARSWYCGWAPAIGAELSRGTLSLPLLQTLRQLDEASSVLEKICSEAATTALSLHRRSARLRSDRVMDLKDRKAIEEMGRRMGELDQLIDRLGKTHSPNSTISGFAKISKVLMHNLRGELLSELGKESADSYRQLEHGVRLLRQWVHFTLNLARPVAITGKPDRAEARL